MDIMIGCYHQHHRHRRIQHTSFLRLFSSSIYNLVFSLTLILLSVNSWICCPTLALLLPPLSSSLPSSQEKEHDGQFVVIGKIIVDEYGAPPSSFDSKTATNTKSTTTAPTVGGGGPQAAWGAAASLAALTHLHTPHSTPKPPPQPVTLLGGVGALDWTDRETLSLLSSLDSCCSDPILISKKDHVTPRIQLWHDANQNIQWFPLNDSFGDMGADGLWFDTPSTSDILFILKKMEKEEKVGLHCIIEGGVNGAGKGGDIAPLLDSDILQLVDFVSVEPVTFPQKDTNQVSKEDATHCAEILQRVMNSVKASSREEKKSVVFSPDRQLFDALPLSFVQSTTSNKAVVDSFAVRDGPNGSFLHQQNEKHIRIPAAKLQTSNQQPINPTGAGNAYAAAYAAARSIGYCSPQKAACIATGVGAVVCEYEHLPPWEWSVIERVCEAAREVSAKVGMDIMEEVVDQ